jgi:DNA processing protein
MNNNSFDLLYKIALTKIDGVGDVIARSLVDTFGDAQQVFKRQRKDLQSIKGISSLLAQEILKPEVLRKAEDELKFIEKNAIQVFFYTDSDYPFRLKECIDAPILIYYKGKADLNASKIISIVGTRKSTSYGNDFCTNFSEEISLLFPDVLVVSGLAYGIDINAHRAALQCNLPTVGVLAHGLDRIYPAAHRKVAVEMLENGGLLTEFSSGTEPDKFNFVRRNRIVAGMADALIVVQSGLKGGSLITADLANSYSKDVFAVPGRIVDTESVGCNLLVEQNKAILLQSVDSFVRSMGWDTIKNTKRPKQQELFLDLSADEQLIYDLLKNENVMHINLLSNQVGLPMSTLMAVLFSMEMRGIVETVPGGLYKLK